jgi:hypothetical protein
MSIPAALIRPLSCGVTSRSITVMITLCLASPPPPTFKTLELKCIRGGHSVGLLAEMRLPDNPPPGAKEAYEMVTKSGP